MIGLLPFLLVGAAATAAPAPLLTRLDKMARILAMEDARNPGDGELERDLADPDRGVRRRAALAAGRIGDDSLGPALLRLLSDPEAEVRQMAAFSLGLLADKRASDALVAALKDPEAVVRARAAEALGRIGDAAVAPALAALVVETIPKEATVLTVRGDDPGSARDPWLPQRLALFALVRLKDVPAAETALLSAGRASTGGRRRGPRCAWRRRRCGRCWWPPRRPRTRSRGRWPPAGSARSRIPPRWTWSRRCCATATSRWR